MVLLAAVVAGGLLAEAPETLMVGPYRAVASNPPNEEGSFELHLGEERVMQARGGRFSLSDFSDFPGVPSSWKNGSDITGDGTPDLVVSEYSGGAHCCWMWQVISLGPGPRVLLELENDHSNDFPFKDFDGHGVFEVERHDWSFAYWNASFAESPRLILTYRMVNGKPVFAADLMRKPPLPTAELRKRSAAIKWEFNEQDRLMGFNIPPMLWIQMLDLIQIGNNRQVEEFTRLAWHPDAVPARTEFLKMFYDQLRQSPNARDIETLLTDR